MMIVKLFGGSELAPNSDRELSEIEISVLESIIIRILGNLRESWSTVIDLRPRLGQIETNPEFAQMLPPTEMVALVTLETQIGQAKGMINLCLPFVTIEPVISRLTKRYMYSMRKGRIARRETPEGYGANIPVDVELCTNAPQLSLSELSSLAKGAMIPLESWDTGDAYLRSGGVEIPCMLDSTEGHGGLNFILPNASVTDAERATIGPTGETAIASHDEEVGELLAEPITEMRDELQEGLAKLVKRIDALGSRQDEMADQVLLAGMSETTPPVSQEEQEGDWDAGPFAFLRPTDGDALCLLVKEEHPQLIAMLLSHVDTPLASQVIECLEPDLQVDVAKRLFSIATVSSDVLRNVGRVLEIKIPRMSDRNEVADSGHEKLAEILELVSKSAEEHIRVSLESQNPEILETLSESPRESDV